MSMKNWQQDGGRLVFIADLNIVWIREAIKTTLQKEVSVRYKVSVESSYQT
jgi:hypothetical protein